MEKTLILCANFWVTSRAGQLILKICILKGIFLCNLMLLRTFMVNVGAYASPDLEILTIWDPLKGTFGEIL